jgi:capsular polysaccharide biosynthesis protein
VNVSIAEAATVPALPTLSLAWMLIGGFFVASVSSVGTAYAVDRLDTSFRTPDELGRYLDVKVLASIPTSGARQ